MDDNDELKNIPPMVPDRDDVDSHISNKRSQSQEIVRPSYYTQKVKVSTWPVRIMLTLLTLGMLAGGYGAYTIYGEYQNNLRQADLRIGDLELRLALAGESSAESDSNLMENINRSIEQYDLLWRNWRENNRTFEEFQGEIARLKLVNEGQNETAANNSQQIASTNRTLMTNETMLNTLTTELAQMNLAVTSLNAEMLELEGMREGLQTIRQSLNSGDSTVLGLLGRVEYMEESMESVNANRQQINASLFRIQEDIEALQRAMNRSGGGI